MIKYQWVNTTGVGKRILADWLEKSMFTMFENGLMNQVIQNKGWLIDIEIAWISRKARTDKDFDKEIVEEAQQSEVNELRTVEAPVDETDPIVHEDEEIIVPEADDGQNMLLNRLFELMNSLINDRTPMNLRRGDRNDLKRVTSWLCGEKWKRFVVGLNYYQNKSQESKWKSNSRTWWHIT